jgi:hypothetical protein
MQCVAAHARTRGDLCVAQPIKENGDKDPDDETESKRSQPVVEAAESEIAMPESWSSRTMELRSFSPRWRPNLE